MLVYPYPLIHGAAVQYVFRLKRLQCRACSMHQIFKIFPGGCANCLLSDGEKTDIMRNLVWRHPDSRGQVYRCA